MKGTDDAIAQARAAMVEGQLRRRGIASAEVLATMGSVPRHVYAGHRDPPLAYGDHPLPIGYRQTISQPYMVARMVELCALQPAARVLEVGAGSGYQTAVLAALCHHVVAVEIVPELAERAARTLAEQGVTNVTVHRGDGSLGHPQAAPYDAIVVAAGAPAVPKPLQDQLVDGGRLVIPVGDQSVQTLFCHVRHGDRLVVAEDTACRFVDLRGEHGWGY